jgi:nucleotide-binding universal stress UspA family protein
MSKFQKVVVSILGEGEEVEIFKVLKDSSLSKPKEIHFVTLVRSIEYGYGLGEYNLIFPVTEDREKIREEKIQKMKSLVEKNLSKDLIGSIKYECLFDENPKHKLCDYVSDNQIDLIIMVARKKRGLFESSFTQYVAKHTDADVMILKHKS